MLFTILISTWSAAKATCQIFTTYFQESNVAILLPSEVEEQTQILQSRFKIWLSVHTVFNAHTLSSIFNNIFKMGKEVIQGREIVGLCCWIILQLLT